MLNIFDLEHLKIAKNNKFTYILLCRVFKYFKWTILFLRNREANQKKFRNEIQAENERLAKKLTQVKGVYNLKKWVNLALR